MERISSPYAFHFISPSSRAPRSRRPRPRRSLKSRRSAIVVVVHGRASPERAEVAVAGRHDDRREEGHVEVPLSYPRRLSAGAMMSLAGAVSRRWAPTTRAPTPPRS